MEIIHFIIDYIVSRSEWLSSIVVGGLMTWIAARIYYLKAGNELKAEAESLKRLNLFIIQGLESGGIAKFSRDENGEINSLVITVGDSATIGPLTSSGGVAPSSSSNEQNPQP
jgi:hypothetical protein